MASTVRAPRRLRATQSQPGSAPARRVDTPLVNTPRVSAALAAVLAAIFVFWAYLDRNLWFFGDEWDFLTRRGFHGAYFSIWAPHNEHWSVIPILVWRAIFSVWHLSSYWPYLVPVLLAHLGVVYLLWARCRRAGVAPVLSGAFALLMGLFGTGAENLAWAFQLGFVGSVLFGLIALQLAERDHPSPLLVSASLACSLMCSGVGIAMTLAVALLALRRGGLTGVVRHVGVPIAGYTVWFALAGRSGLRATGDTFNRGVFAKAPIFVARDLASALGHAWGVAPLGPAVLVMLVAYVLAARRALWATHPGALSLGAAAICFYFMAALGRDRISLTDSPSRYGYIGFALLLPLQALALSRAANAVQALRELHWARTVRKGLAAPAPFPPDPAPGVLTQISMRPWRQWEATEWASALTVALVLGATGANIAAAHDFTSSRTTFVRALGDQIITTSWLTTSPEQARRAINRYPIWASGAASGYLTAPVLRSLALGHLLPRPTAPERSSEAVRWAESWLDIAATSSPMYSGRFSLARVSGDLAKGAQATRLEEPPTFLLVAGRCRTFVAGGGHHQHNLSATYLARHAALQLTLRAQAGRPASVQVSLGRAGGRLRTMLAEAWGLRAPSTAPTGRQIASTSTPPPAGSWLGQILVFHPGQRSWVDMSVPGAALVISLERGQVLTICGLAPGAQ